MSKKFSTIMFLSVVTLGLLINGVTAQASTNTYEDLLVLFEDWREFESPPLLEGAPDYTAQPRPAVMRS